MIRRAFLKSLAVSIAGLAASVAVKASCLLPAQSSVVAGKVVGRAFVGRDLCIKALCENNVLIDCTMYNPGERVTFDLRDGQRIHNCVLRNIGLNFRRGVDGVWVTGSAFYS